METVMKSVVCRNCVIPKTWTRSINKITLTELTKVTKIRQHTRAKQQNITYLTISSVVYWNNWTESLHAGILKCWTTYTTSPHFLQSGVTRNLQKYYSLCCDFAVEYRLQTDVGHSVVSRLCISLIDSLEQNEWRHTDVYTTSFNIIDVNYIVRDDPLIGTAHFTQTILTIAWQTNYMLYYLKKTSWVA